MQTLRKNINILDLPDSTPHQNMVCVATNGMRRENGDAIMREGMALLFHKTFNLESRLGECLREHGNVVNNLGEYERDGRRFNIIAFPTDDDLHNILESARQLKQMVDATNYTHVYLPPVGCGYGDVRTERVIEALQPILDDDRFIMVVPEMGSIPLNDVFDMFPDL